MELMVRPVRRGSLVLKVLLELRVRRALPERLVLLLQLWMETWATVTQPKELGRFQALAAASGTVPWVLMRSIITLPATTTRPAVVVRSLPTLSETATPLLVSQRWPPTAPAASIRPVVTNRFFLTP